MDLKLEKREQSFPIDYPLYWEHGVEISKIREDLDAVEKLGATHINISSDVSFDVPYTDIKAESVRMETDEEFKIRVDLIEKRAQQKKLRELQEFERLREKFGYVLKK